jgi:hypothetical protein
MTHRSGLAQLIPVLLLATLVACSSKSPAGPGPTPTPTPTPTPVATRIISLTGSLAFGSVATGQSADRTLTIANLGNAVMTVSSLTGPSGYTSTWTSGTIAAGASHVATIRFSPTAPQTYSGTLTVNGDHTSGTNTIPISGTGNGPKTSFGSGRHLVNTDIVAARYFADPITGCYWERQKGLSGSINDVIANDFVSFNAAQIIVDILGSDVAFQTDSECNTWFQTPRHPAQGSIGMGTWLVGAQIGTGVYRSTVSAGCYWERLRDFTGNLSGIIDNDFVSSGGSYVVEIRSGDIGFSTDDECGTWTRVSEPSGSQLASTRRNGTVESNRVQQRSNWPVRRH